MKDFVKLVITEVLEAITVFPDSNPKFMQEDLPTSLWKQPQTCH